MTINISFSDTTVRVSVEINGAVESAVTELPKRPWVGLTEAEVELYWDWEDWQTGAGRSTIFEMVRDIEAKLKEKQWK